MVAPVEVAEKHGMPLADVLMIALNAHGLRNTDGSGRIRCQVALDCAPEHTFRTILASDRQGSPFVFHGQALRYENTLIGTISGIEHDDARLGYFRRDTSVLTLNTNARSHCTGCVFCPNTGSDASDPRIDTRTDELQTWLRALIGRHNLDDLSSVRQVNLSTSCFGDEVAAIEHIEYLRRTFDEFGFNGRIGILSSVIRSTRGFDRLTANVGAFALFLTMECVTQRSLWLKDSKSSLSAEQGLLVLQRARAAGCDTGVTLVVGLDPIDQLCEWLDKALGSLTDFPNLQVFQVHSRFMAVAGLMGEEPLSWFLRARIALETTLAVRQDLQPVHWQNYRPFWYTRYRNAALS